MPAREREGATGGDDRFRPLLTGRRVRLRALASSDYELLRRVELAPHLLQRWRNRGTTPSPGDWMRMVDQPVLAQFLVVDDRDGTEKWLGLVSVYNPDFQHGYAYLAVTKLAESDASTKALEGTVLFLERGATVAGVVQSQTAETIVLRTSQDELVEVAVDEVELRKPDLSAMPQDVSKNLTRRELRDLIEYLANL